MPLPNRMQQMESDRAQIVWPNQLQLGRRAVTDLGHPAGLHPRHNHPQRPDSAGGVGARRVPHRPENHRRSDGCPAHRTPRRLPAMELHHPTADSGLTLIETPGSKSFTRPKWVGSAVLRKEDERLLTGQGSFLDDFEVAGLLEAAMLRSPHAHARIVSLDVSAARTLPGVHAVITGE